MGVGVLRASKLVNVEVLSNKSYLLQNRIYPFCTKFNVFTTSIWISVFQSTVPAFMFKFIAINLSLSLCFVKGLRISCVMRTLSYLNRPWKKCIWRERKFDVVVYQCFRNYLIIYIYSNSSSFIRFNWLSIAFNWNILIIYWMHLFLLSNRT